MPRPRPRPIAGAVLGDARGDGRALRVTWHADEGVVVMSVWKDNVCTTTVRLTPDQVAPLVETLQAGSAVAQQSASAS
jgi:hypothetical protein